MYSLTAPKQKVWFDQSVVFWSAFYYLMHAHDSSSMRKTELSGVLKRICSLFEVKMGHFFKNTKINARVDEEIYGEPNGASSRCAATKDSGGDIIYSAKD